MKVLLMTPLLSLVTAAVLEKRQTPPANYGGRVARYQGVDLYGAETQRDESVTAFLKIPYAAPPLGNLRFRPPEDPNPIWSGTTLCDQLGPKCMQVSSSPQENTSEDCLHLNIYSPKTGQNLPVVVFIHGGSFTGGSAINYYGSKLAKERQMVVVTVNYRLGVFGFMAGEKLQSEINAEGRPSLNVGLLDQKKAFEWVKKNIAAFGGDPTRITAMGQSVGAISIGAHLLAESGNQKLFDRAYLVSGAAPLLYLTPSQLDYSFNLYAQSMGCPNNDQQLTCLRSLSATVLNSASALYSAFPVLDGNYIKEQAITQLEAGQFSKVPLFIQTNKDEGSLFPLYFGIFTEDQATENIRALIPILKRKGRNDLVNLYDPAAHPIYPGAAYGDFFADTFFYCPSTLMADSYSKHSVEVYTARNNHIPLDNPFSNLQVPTGVYHGAEMPYLFKDRSEITKEERKFGKSMRIRLGVFAEGSSPNPSWLTYSSGTNAAYDIETDQLVLDDRSLKCNTILNLIRQNNK